MSEREDVGVVSKEFKEWFRDATRALSHPDTQRQLREAIAKAKANADTR